MAHAWPMPGVAGTPKKDEAFLACEITELNGPATMPSSDDHQDRAATGMGHIIAVIGMDHHVALHFSPRKRTTRRSDTNVLSNSSTRSYTA